MLDEMEAMVRHPQFRQSLPLWRSIFGKNYVGLTEEEDKERDAPRTRFRVAAIMEADRQWISRSIQDIRERGEAAWALEAVNGPCGDLTNTIPLSLRVPGDLSPDAMQRCLGRVVREKRRQAGIAPVQHPRRPEVDMWTVHDLKHKQGLGLLAITQHLFKVTGKPAYDAIAGARYAQVRRAYRTASAMIQVLDSPLYATPRANTK